MILNTSGVSFEFFTQSIANGIHLMDDAQRAKLTNEIKADPEQMGYAGKDAQAVYRLLVTPYSKHVDERKVEKTVVTGSELRNWITPIISTVRLGEIHQSLKDAWLPIMIDWQGVDASYSFNPHTSEKWQALLSKSVQLVYLTGNKVITQADIDALIYITVPAGHAIQPCRWEALGFNMLKIPEIRDIAEVL